MRYLLPLMDLTGNFLIWSVATSTVDSFVENVTKFFRGDVMLSSAVNLSVSLVL